MKDKLKGLLIGITVGLMLTGASAYATSGVSIKAVMQKVHLYVDGKKQTTTNVITYKNTTYFPVRTMSKALNKEVSLKWDNLYVGKLPTIKVTPEQAADLVYAKIKKAADKYDLHFIANDDAEDGRYLVEAYEDMTDHITSYGWYYVDMYTGIVYEWNLVTGDLKQL